MMNNKNQLTFADTELTGVKRITKKAQFLEKMNDIIPWDVLEETIAPFYYKNHLGRKARDLNLMIRMYLLQIWYNLSDEGLEDEIYESVSMRNFVGLDLMSETVPDATTLLHFRHLLEKHELGKKIFDSINGYLTKAGYIYNGGTIVDATIISAPGSTKNKKQERAPEMHSTKKGNIYYFGARLHAGQDAYGSMTHSISLTAANVNDIEETHHVIREDDDTVWGDAGYIGIEKRKEIANDQRFNHIEFRINKRPSVVRALGENIYKWCDRKEEYLKSKVRCKVEHTFHILKQVFKFKKFSYRGIAKNLNRLYATFAMINMYKLAQIIG